jgi:hypothetical protein
MKQKAGSLKKIKKIDKPLLPGVSGRGMTL